MVRCSVCKMERRRFKPFPHLNNMNPQTYLRTLLEGAGEYALTEQDIKIIEKKRSTRVSTVKTVFEKISEVEFGRTVHQTSGKRGRRSFGN